MLDNLLNTKLKRKVLAVLFAFPERSFSAQEIKAVAGGGIGTVNKTLAEFVKNDVVRFVSKNRKKLFQINPKYSLYAELEDLAREKTLERSDDEITKRLKRITKLKLAIMTGIFTSQPYLPVDLVLVGDGVSRNRITRMLAELEKLIGLEINFTLFGRKEYEYRLLMHDKFLRDVLDNPHLVSVNHIRKK